MEARGDDPSAFATPTDHAPAQPAATEWFASVDGSPVGPLTTEELVSRIATGVLDWDAHLWREGYAEWKTVGDSDTIVRAVASSRGSLDERPRGDSTERTTTPQDPEDDAPTTATLDEAPTIATLEDSPTRVAYDETPTRMFSSQSAPPVGALQPIARASFASRAAGSRPPGELAPARVKAPSYTPGVLPPVAHNNGNAALATAESYPAPIALPYEPPVQASFTGGAQPLPMQRAPGSVAPVAGYAGGEGSGLIDIRALASLAQSQTRQQSARAPQSRIEPRTYERLPAMQAGEMEVGYEQAEPAQNDPLASFGTTHGVAFAALDSIAPVSRKERPKDATVPLAILTGAFMIAAAAFAAVYVTRATPAASISTAAQPMPTPPTPTSIAADKEEPSAAAAPANVEPAAAAEVAAPAEPPTPEPAQAEAEAEAPAPEPVAVATPRAEKRGTARKQRAARGDAPSSKTQEDEEAEEPAPAKAEAKPPSVDDILLADSDKKPAEKKPAAEEPEPELVAAPAKTAKAESASRSIDDLLDSAVTEKKSAPAASALAEAPSRDDVLKAMRGIESEVRACAASEGTPVQGTANVAITVAGSTGKVTSADVTGIQGQIGSCIARVARKASFSPFSRDKFSVSYPYRFK